MIILQHSRWLKIAILSVAFYLTAIIGTNTSIADQSKFEISAAENVAWPSDQIRVDFTKYWTNLFNQQPKDAFELEAPYVKEIVTQSRYNLIMGQYKSNSVKFEIDDITHITKSLISIQGHMLIGNRNSPDKSFLNDKWVLVGDKWSHVLKNPFLLPQTRTFNNVANDNLISKRR